MTGECTLGPVRTAVIVAVLAAPATAHAYTPAQPPEIVEISAPAPLRIARHALDLAITRDGVVPEVALVDRLDVENPSDEDVVAIVLAAANRTESIAFDGGHEATAEDRSKAEQVAAIHVSVPAHASLQLTLRAKLRGFSRWAGGEIATGALATRHPYLAPDAVSDGYLRATFGSTTAPITVAHRAAEGVDARVEKLADRVEISAEVLAPRHPYGGPFAGVGTTTGGDAALRARLGWEAAPRPWLIGALMAESDLRRRWLAGATLEATTPSFAFIPSLSLGAGVPVQLAPTTRVGARFLSTVHLPIVGVAFTYDVYPGTANEAILTEFAVVVRAGL